jgi:hypothetical protein
MTNFKCLSGKGLNGEELRYAVNGPISGVNSTFDIQI